MAKTKTKLKVGSERKFDGKTFKLFDYVKKKDTVDGIKKRSKGIYRTRVIKTNLGYQVWLRGKSKK